MGLATLIVKRKPSGVYYFRQAIPKHLQEIVGAKEFKRSLHTKDEREAISKGIAVALEYDQLIQEAEHKLKNGDSADVVLNEETIRAQVRLVLQAILDEDEQDHLRHPRSDGDYDHYDDIQAEMTVDLADKMDDEYFDVHHTGCGIRYAEHVAERAGISIPLKRRERHIIMRLCLDHLDQLKERTQGHWREDDAGAQTPGAGKPVAPVESSAPTLTQCFEGWKVERKPAEKSADEYERFVHRFNDVAGGDLPVDQITVEHVRDYKEALLNAPSHPPNELRKLPFDEMIKRADPSLPTLRPRAVMKAFKSVKTILTWAVHNGYIEQSPGDRVKYTPSDVEAKERRKFHPGEIQKIFDATSDEKGCVFWLPRLGLYTGARLRELAQSEPKDIHHNKENDFYYLDIHADGDGRSLKTKGSVRKVPLHPDLIAWGFIDYVNQRKNAGGPLWYDQGKLDKYGSPAGFSRKFNRLVKDIIEVDTEHEMKDFHSFRHTFKDTCRACGIPEDVHDALTGHSNNSVSRTYGGEFPIGRLWEAVRGLVFPR